MSQMYYQIPAVAEDSSALFCQFEQDSCIIVNYLIVPSGPSYSMARVYFVEYSGEPACTCNLLTLSTKCVSIKSIITWKYLV